MLTKLQVTGKIKVETGMHIGGSSAFAAIGSVDSPVIKDARNNTPIIPGSSLKGKLRSLLAKEYNEKVCGKPEDDCDRIARLFGTSKKNEVKPSRLLFSDSFLVNEDELRKLGLQSLTEVKFENSIDRASAVANPRQIERVVRGSIFSLDIIYNVDKDKDIIEDFQTLSDGFNLLSYDYLGGSGSRGYGKVKFVDINVEVVAGKLDESIVSRCNDLLNK